MRDDFGMWLNLDADDRGLPASVGAGLATVYPPIATFPLEGLIVVPLRQDIERERTAVAAAQAAGHENDAKYHREKLAKLWKRRRPPLHPSGRSRPPAGARTVWREVYERERREDLDPATRAGARREARVRIALVANQGPRQRQRPRPSITR